MIEASLDSTFIKTMSWKRNSFVLKKPLAFKRKALLRPQKLETYCPVHISEKKISILEDLEYQKCRQAGWSCKDRKDWKTCENENRLQETTTKLIEFCFSSCHCMIILDGKPVGKNCGDCTLGNDGNRIYKIPAICTKSKSQCAAQVNYTSLELLLKIFISQVCYLLSS